MEKPTCETCLYYFVDENNQKKGVCCRYPVSLKGRIETTSKAWCGEHPDFIYWLSTQRKKEKGVKETPEIDQQSFQQIFMDTFRKSLNGLKKRKLSPNEVDVSFPGVILDNSNLSKSKEEKSISRSTGVNMAFDPDSKDQLGFFLNRAVNLEPDPICKEFDKLAQMDLEEERKIVSQEIEGYSKENVTNIRCNGKKKHEERVKEVKELIRQSLTGKEKVNFLQNP